MLNELLRCLTESFLVLLSRLQHCSVPCLWLAGASMLLLNVLYGWHLIDKSAGSKQVLWWSAPGWFPARWLSGRKEHRFLTIYFFIGLPAWLMLQFILCCFCKTRWCFCQRHSYIVMSRLLAKRSMTLVVSTLAPWVVRHKKHCTVEGDKASTPSIIGVYADIASTK